MPLMTWPVKWRDHRIEIELFADAKNDRFRYRLFVDCKCMAEERREGAEQYVTLRANLKSSSKQSIGVKAKVQRVGEHALCRVFVDGKKIYDSPDPSVLATRLSELELSVRAGNGCARAGIDTVGDLLGHSEADLLSIPSLEKNSVTELEHRLADLGLSLMLDC